MYRHATRTEDGRDLELNTVHSWGESRLLDVRFLGGYLTAASIEVVSRSGADPDTTATQTWWKLGDLVLHSSPGGPELISWSGSAAPGDRGPPPYDPGQLDSLSLTRAGNQFPRFLAGHGSPPDPDATITITINPPGRPPIIANLSCDPGPQLYQQPRLCDGGTRTGISLLDPALYAGTPLEGAFSAIRPALATLLGSGDPLDGLGLIAGEGSRTGADPAASKVWGLAASFLDAGEHVDVDVAGSSSLAHVASIRNHFTWRTLFRATDFEVTPSGCSDDGAEADCPVVSGGRSRDGPNNQIGGISHFVLGGEEGSGVGPAAPSTAQQSVQTVAQLLPRNAKGERPPSPPSPSTGSDLSQVHQSALAPTLNAAPGHGSRIPWLAVAGGLALVALGVLRWRRERRAKA